MSDTPDNTVQTTPIEETTKSFIDRSVTIEKEPPSLADLLPADLLSDPSLADIKDFKTLAKNYIETKRYVGSSVRIPTADSSIEDKTAFLTKISGLENIIIKPSSDSPELTKAFKAKLGIPDTIDGYTYQFDEEEHKDLDKDFLKTFNKFALEHDLSTSQANKMLRKELDARKTSKDLQTKAEEAATEKLKQTWGNAYEDKMAQAKAALNIMSEKMKDEMKALTVTGALTNPAIVMMLADIGSLTVEKNNMGVSYKPVNKTPDDALTEIRTVLSNNKHAYFDKTNPEHNRAKDRMEKLYQMAYPDQANR